MKQGGWVSIDTKMIIFITQRMIIKRRDEYESHDKNKPNPLRCFVHHKRRKKKKGKKKGGKL